MSAEEQGVRKDRYHVIPRTLSFIFKGDEVLLIKGAPTKKIWANKYNAIGGHVERGEDVMSSARREICEETGLEVEDLKLAGTIIVDVDPQIGIALFIFRAKNFSGQLRESAEGELEWHQPADIASLPVVADLPVILDRMTKKPGEVFSGRSYYEKDKLIIQFDE